MSVPRILKIAVRAFVVETLLTSRRNIWKNCCLESFGKFTVFLLISHLVVLLLSNSTANVCCERSENFQNCCESICGGITLSSSSKKIFLFYNSVENSITSIGMFQKVALKEILTSLLTAVACLHSAVCNAIDNELLTKFLEGVLKLTEIFQEVTFNGVPF